MYVRYVQARREVLYVQVRVVGVELVHKHQYIPPILLCLSTRSIIITFVTMNISPSVLATLAVLASSGVWVSVKNDDVEVSVVAVLYVVAFLL